MPLFWLSLAFLMGLVLGTGVALPWWGWGGAAAVLGGAAFFEKPIFGRTGEYLRLRNFLRLPLSLVLAVLLLGAMRQELAHQPLTPADLAWYNNASGASGRVRGVMYAEPENGTHISLEVEAQSITPRQANAAGETLPVRGRLEVYAIGGQALHYGDLVELEGSLQAPDSSQKDALARRGILSVMNYPSVKVIQNNAGDPLLALLYNLRQQARSTINAILPAPESGLLVGILLGIPNDLPAAEVAAFQATGTAHIWAISGFNIAIVSGLLVTLLGRLLPRRRLAASLLAIGAVTLYTLLVGANPSVVRAAIMGTVGMFGPLLGRRQVGANSLTFTAAVMCLFDPSLPYNISFQLSFMATCGLVVFGDPLQRWVKGLLERRISREWARRAAGPVCEYFLLTLAAQLMTLPITAIHFQRISLSAVIANPLILPVQSLVMVLGGLALLGGLIFIPLGQALAVLAWPMLAYTLRVVEWLAPLPGGVLVGTMEQAVGLAWYAVTGALALGFYRAAYFKRWLRPGIVIIGAALLAGVAWRAGLAAPDGRVHLSAFNVNGLPAVLIQGRNGQSLLVNAGADDTRLANMLSRRLPPFDARLDAWLVTGRSTTPLEEAGLLVKRFPPGRVFLGGSLPTNKTYNDALDTLNSAGVELHMYQAGEEISLGAEACMRVLAETPGGTALLVEWQNLRVLLPGGVAIKDLKGMGLDGISALVLGPADLETQTAMDWSELGAAVVLWQKIGAPVDQPGWLSLAGLDWVELTSDGTRLWTEVGNQ